MPLGSSKSSRIKICGLGVILSLTLMAVPFGLALWQGEAYIFFSFLAWVGLFFAGTFLALLVSQLVKIEAEGRTGGKFLGLEVPFEFRGVTVVLLGFYVLLGFFYLATDLEGQLSAKAMRGAISDLEEAVETQLGIVNTFETIHTGNFGGDLNMLKLSYHCGQNDQTERITEWNRYVIDTDRSSDGAMKSSDEPFPVSQQDYVYRVRYRPNEQAQNFEDSPLKVTVSLDTAGVLTARIAIEDPESYRGLWEFCSNPTGEATVVQSDFDVIESKADPLSGG